MLPPSKHVGMYTQLRFANDDKVQDTTGVTKIHLIARFGHDVC